MENAVAVSVVSLHTPADTSLLRLLLRDTAVCYRRIAISNFQHEHPKRPSTGSVTASLL